MSTNREKTTNVMGLVVSLLLHGIFFAGCLALDASSVSATAIEQPTTEINQVTDASAMPKPKS